MKNNFTIALLFFLAPLLQLKSQGNVYLIIGSDTAIWDGMNTNKFNCYYNYNVIPDNTRNYFEVMQQSYRDEFSDSYGNKLKLTWWLMCGNIFRYATNKNVPYPNIIVPYQSKKYYGNQFQQFGDELTLHYHTFVWTDYDNDGIYYWNQAKEFRESKDDFYYTLAQLLIEENIFPVSFRSGWNHMSNEWQAELDKLLPYSMHNEAPAYRTDETEPIDNVYDWRLASKEFVPYRPSPDNYQLAGNGKGWNLHSRYVGSVSQNEMNTIFTKAKTVDQVVCLWGHVWDDLFPEYVERIDSLAKISAGLNPSVKFKYCTAVEGMQLWRKVVDKDPPQVNIIETTSGDNISYKVQTDEAIFQDQPFLALKSIDESYLVVDFIKTGNNEWQSLRAYNKKNIVKAGLAVTDTLGNLTTRIIKYLPDDIYIDNTDPNFRELNGEWLNETKAAWGLNSRKSTLKSNDSSKVRWTFNITQGGNYNIFLQIPKVEPACKNVSFRIYSNNILLDRVEFSNTLPTMDWVYITTKYFEVGSNNSVEMTANGNGQQSTVLSADVIKISPLVREKWITTQNKIVDLGKVAKGDTVKYKLVINNVGIENLSITSINSKNNLVSVSSSFPITVSKFSSTTLNLLFYSNFLGSKTDTLFINSDDPFNPILKIAFNAEVTNYFKIVDNEETTKYKEYGIWLTSNAQAFGPSSRYATLNQSPKAYAVFTTSLNETGNYDISFIVPQTVNASNRALYVIKQGATLIDSLYIDQNLGSGVWILIKNALLTNLLPVQIKIADDGKSTAGVVLRADAVRFTLTSSTSVENDFAELPNNFELFQNYPNPFNPSTTISFQLPTASHVTLKVFDIIGREVATLVNENKPAGYYTVNYDASHSERSRGMTSGVYIYTFQCNGYQESRKMVLMK